MTTTHTAVFTSHWPDVAIPDIPLPQFRCAARRTGPTKPRSSTARPGG